MNPKEWYAAAPEGALGYHINTK
ncbi:hypothetical protein BN1723_021045, partial [Verticillium longisporum]